MKTSARNRFDGTVSRVVEGAINDEITIDAAGGGQIAAVVTNDSATHLGLVPGSAVSAVFKASAVIVGVAA